MGGCHQIDDATLSSSQAECDPHWIAPLLFFARSEALWSGIKGKVSFFCYKKGRNVVFFTIRFGKVLLTHFMLKGGNKLTTPESFTMERSGRPT